MHEEIERGGEAWGKGVAAGAVDAFLHFVMGGFKDDGIFL